ncbi:hypothetical protein PTR64_24950 [Serratia nevei]|uniref:hypothetical protein n=1 Tax=Serratia nevei TaxID=2703794 RepID=UPI00313EC190
MKYTKTFTMKMIMLLAAVVVSPAHAGRITISNPTSEKLSNWYVNSNYTESQAFDIVKKSIDSDDKLIVVDASNNSAAWVNLAPEVPEYIKDQWFK